MSKEMAVKDSQSMIAASKEALFKIVLVVFGLTFIFGLYSLTYLWPSGWGWEASGTLHFHTCICSTWCTPRWASFSSWRPGIRQNTAA